MEKLTLDSRSWRICCPESSCTCWRRFRNCWMIFSLTWSSCWTRAAAPVVKDSSDSAVVVKQLSEVVSPRPVCPDPPAPPPPNRKLTVDCRLLAARDKFIPIFVLKCSTQAIQVNARAQNLLSSFHSTDKRWRWFSKWILWPIVLEPEVPRATEWMADDLSKNLWNNEETCCCCVASSCWAEWHPL